VAEPSQRAQPGEEAILSASCDHELRQALKPLTQRSLRDIKRALSVMSARDRVASTCASEKRAVIHPLSLDKLELAAQMSSNERKHQTSFLPIIFKDSLWQLGAVGSPTTNHSMDAGDSGNVGVTRVRSAYMRSARCFVTDWIVFLK